ncbi:hypothetical protein ACL6C3_19780 [Capilliphycus salinus ALCB114379]|uniref:hypothetical protein n=1 Tax=Capilliphycus salinus TaxID=2768948 RepID=UPI0039A70F0E
MNSPEPELQKFYQSAKQGNPKAIAVVLNSLLKSENIVIGQADIQNNYLYLIVESAEIPPPHSSIKRIYDALKLFKLQHIQYVIIQARKPGETKLKKIDCIDLTQELETPQPEPEPSAFEKFQQKFQQKIKWPAWFPYPSSFGRMIILILWLFIVLRIVTFWGVIIGGTVSVISDDIRPILQALGIGFLGSILVLSYVYHVLFYIFSYIRQLLLNKSSVKAFQWFPTPLSLWQGIYTPIVLILSVLTVFLVVLPFMPWGTCQQELLLEDKNCYYRLQNYLASLEVIATIVWITSGLYLYQIEYLIRQRVSGEKIIKFIALVVFSFMSTVLIYTTATNWNYIYGAFANFENPLASSELAENINATEPPGVDTVNSPKAVVNSPKIETEKPEVIPPQVPDENFKKGIENATNASVLVQTAKSKNEWEFVETQWQNAIDYMKQVQPDDPNYEAAQKRVVQYQKNLEYARLAGNQAKE